jgi:hypothetical protein
LRRDAETLAEPADALMVMRLHRRTAAEQPSEPRASLDGHVVIRERARRVVVRLVAEDVGKMLDEIAATRDVQNLRAAADREHRHIAREGALEQRELGVIAFFADADGLWVRLLSVELWVDVGAAGEDQPVHRIEGLVDSVRRRRHEERSASGSLDRMNVVRRDERRLLIPVAPLCGDDVGRDADDRPSHCHDVIGLLRGQHPGHRPGDIVDEGARGRRRRPDPG